MISQVAPRYILAKYVPDLGRMEPRNIGVFVWWKGEFCAKFLESDDVEVNDLETYERWVTYWSRNISEDAIRPRRGRPVAKGDPACIDALISTQKGNYILVDSGELLKPIRKTQIHDATDYLFNELVADLKKQAKETGAATRFHEACGDLLKNAGITFKTKQAVKCTWHGVSRHLHPDYYIGNGKPDAIYQRVKMSDERSINGSVLLVASLLEAAEVQKANCRFFIRSGDLGNEIADEGMKLMEQICKAIDIEDENAIDQVQELSPSGV